MNMLKSICFLAATARLVASQSSAGFTTRYWDCCKPSCSWSGVAAFSNPVTTCDINDQPLSVADGGDAQSACASSDGTAFACSSQQPWAINENLAYGFAALTGSEDESDTCCGCYLLDFTSGDVEGKKMVVQATNIGYDVSSTQFDLAIPGGGVGEFTTGCSTEWGAPATGWGAQYGGVSTESQCTQLPSVLQPGCDFRFTWMENPNNPTITYTRVSCPDALVAKTNCRRDDDGNYPAPPTGDTSGSSTTTSTKTSTTTPPSSKKTTTSTPSPAETTTTSTPRPAETTTTSTPPSSPTTTPSKPNKATQTLYGQCGGSGWTGPTACPTGAACQEQNSYYSQCLATTTSDVETRTPSEPNKAAQTLYGQCGGSGYTGPTVCPSGATCKEQNSYYSQCVN